MVYIFDTNIVLHYLRESQLSQDIENQLHPFHGNNVAIASVVTLGELRAIAFRNKWGERRLSNLENFLKVFVIANINIEEIIENYAYIDTYSQGKIVNDTHGETARNMGKNDLWIAATTRYLDAILLTTDKDFSHLNDKIQIRSFDV
jgi:tRNA(fMet)-specific endonuclease VapC